MSKTITLYTGPTPNGYPVSIALEELGIDYDFKSLSFDKNEQKSPEFLAINPNGRIPAIVDNKRNGFKVFESSAILLYLAAHYDPEGKISFDPVKEADLYSEQVQWLFFTHGGVGPMQGQANHFFRYAPEKIEYGINRYQKETHRLYQVYEDRLTDHDFLVGDKYSLADIKAHGWIRSGPWAGIELENYPKIQAWIERIEARPLTDKGLAIPVKSNLKERLANAEKESAKVREWIMKDQGKK